jgi:hypothetical protein
LNWVERLATDQYVLRAITYAGGRFVAVGWSAAIDSVILTSSDGVNWLQRPSPQDQVLSGVTFGNGHFIATGNPILESGPIITLALTPSSLTGRLALSLTGPTGAAYTIQSSTNLSSWQTVTILSSVQPTTAIFDTLPAAANDVFYRAYSE